MSARHAFQHCYRQLQLDANCSLRELQVAYRRRVRACHPDRARDNQDRRRREIEFHETVYAFRKLSSFHRCHGVMPPPWLLVDETLDESERQAPQTPTDAEQAAHARPRRGSLFGFSRLHGIAVGVFCAGLASAAILQRMDHGQPPAAGTGDGRLTIGMDPQTVVDLQGLPQYTEGSVWFYGDSGVIFERGCVIGWENQPPFPLQTLVRVAYTAETLAPALPLRRDCGADQRLRR